MTSDAEEVPINPKATEEVLVVDVDVAAKPKEVEDAFDNRRVRAFFTCKVLLLVAFSAVLLARWKEMKRVFPWNIVSLNLLVFSVGYLGFALTWLFEAETIFVACAVVFLNSLELALFTGIFRRDIRGLVGIPVFLVTVFFTWYAVALGSFRWLQVPKGYAMYAGIFSLLAMIFVLVDLQLMMNGKNRRVFSPKDPLFATIRLFLDVPRLLPPPVAFIRFFQRTGRQLVVVEQKESAANKTKSFFVRHQYKIALLIMFIWFLTFAFNTHPPHRSFNGECVPRPFENLLSFYVIA
ncbi:hypothetical protein M3Y99_01113500 [Aphelenchoides fujianensis]|nr:hypothetical protein M3Y99_01113500 [Aphelenchoides fujianensis]